MPEVTRPIFLVVSSNLWTYRHVRRYLRFDAGAKRSAVPSSLITIWLFWETVPGPRNPGTAAIKKVIICKIWQTCKIWHKCIICLKLKNMGLIQKLALCEIEFKYFFNVQNLSPGIAPFLRGLQYGDRFLSDDPRWRLVLRLVVRSGGWSDVFKLHFQQLWTCHLSWWRECTVELCRSRPSIPHTLHYKWTIVRCLLNARSRFIRSGKRAVSPKKDSTALESSWS